MDHIRKSSIFGLLLFSVVILLPIMYNRYSQNDLFTEMNMAQYRKTVNRSEMLSSIKLGLPPKFHKTIKIGGTTMVYETCKFIPAAPDGLHWPEQEYLDDPSTINISQVAHAKFSKMWLTHSSTKIGLLDTIHVTIQLYDGLGRKRTIGGDLVRVWMNEVTLGASSTGCVQDNKDGSYVATLRALWVGKPTITAAIITTREAIAITFKRRYICPDYVVPVAVFVHPDNHKHLETTRCSNRPHLPGYSKFCNLTEENFGRPWYCGHPSRSTLQCDDWTYITDNRPWKHGFEAQLYTKDQLPLLTHAYKARVLPGKLTVTVASGSTDKRRHIPNGKCNKAGREYTWQQQSPVGYLYNRKWTDMQCVGVSGQHDIRRCLANTHVILIGDSTMRQLFYSFKKTIPCDFVTEKDPIDLTKRPMECVNSTLNYTLFLKMHEVPYHTSKHLQRQYFKSFQAHLNKINDVQRTIVVLHVYGHFLNTHSSKFYDVLIDMKKGIENLLNRNSNVYIIIKGPHAYSFSRDTERIILTPDKYASGYTRLILHVFKDLKRHVLFLNCLDITVATRQWHIHAESYIIDALKDKVLNGICPY